MTNMKLFLPSLIFSGWLLAAALGNRDDDDRPNFIFIFADDVGLGDLKCYGHPYAKTPHLDRLAREGTKFTQFHMTGNVCPHSRAGLMTGRNPSWFPNYTAHYGFRGATTITNLMQDSGYHTGHIGKWNIGSDPTGESKEYGIDTHSRTGSIGNDPRGREGLRFDDAIDFVNDNKDKPFYLNLWIFATHSPIDPPQRAIDEFSGLRVDRSRFGGHMQDKFDDLLRRGGDISESMKIYLGEMFAMDENIGRLLDALDEAGIADNTVVVFSSDNGPSQLADGVEHIGDAAGLRGEKHSYYQGGVTVPFIVRWPGKIPAGKTNTESVMFGIDWLPSVCSLAKCNMPANVIEGEDISDVWLGSSRSRTQPIYYRGISPNVGIFSRQIMRYGKWKYFKASRELYNLDDDPEERSNIYRSYPEVVRALEASLEVWVDSLPTEHRRLPDRAASFNPNERVTNVPLPDVPGVITEPRPTPAPVAPGPTATPSMSPTRNPAEAPVPPVNPNCKIFTVPFIAEANEFCAYQDETERNSGSDSSCGGTPVDTRTLPSGATGVCRSKCFVGWTQSNEFLDYTFLTTKSNHEISIVFASNRERQTRIEIDGATVARLPSPGNGWHAYDVEKFSVVLEAGSHKLRIIFEDGNVNLCSIEIDSDDVGGTLPPENPTSSPTDPTLSPTHTPTNGDNDPPDTDPTAAPVDPTLAPTNVDPTQPPVPDPVPRPLVKPVRDCSSSSPCRRCQGDCDNDSHCEGELVCFYKDRGDGKPIPGCIGSDSSRTDWCISPFFL